MVAELKPTHRIATFFLATFVLSLNAYTYASGAVQASDVAHHLYYAVLILAGLY